MFLCFVFVSVCVYYLLERNMITSAKKQGLTMRGHFKQSKKISIMHLALLLEWQKIGALNATMIVPIKK